jgi:hypothetical protein|tara:strand:+ start:188 stop:610 length:423 start_codon:yes stop_codon:yes gene_type:complete
MNKINVTYKGKVIGKGYLPELQTKPSHNYSYKITEYETTQNGVSDFDDQTELFKKIFQKHETGINSKNKFVSTKSALDLIEKLEIVAGRKLNTTEQNNIIRQCKQPTPKMKVNKYGRLFGKRQNTSIAKDSLWYKGEGNG